MTSPSASANAVPPSVSTRAVATAVTVGTTSAAQTGRFADGDKVRSTATAQSKDADGDHQPPVNAAATTSTSAVLAAVASLLKGG